MALTDRHFPPEHFDILFAFFGFVVQKLCNFKFQIHFLSFLLFPETGPNRFVPWAGLATVADWRGRATLESHVGQGPRAGLTRARGCHDRHRAAVTGGNGADGSVTGVHEGSREGAHYAQD